ncbi:MAG TPA: hypothetical protein VM513_32400 [Kofleriaceae bacterium]|nr:hypothetical protein [Kofleriaceae bacterium]
MFVVAAACGNPGETASPDGGGVDGVPALPEITIPLDASPQAMHADDEAVYVWVGTELRRYPLSGGAHQVLVTGEYANELARVGDQLFAVTSNKLVTVKTDGSGRATLHSGSQLGRGLAASATRVYVPDGSSVVGMSWAGANKTTRALEMPSELLMAGSLLWVVQDYADYGYFDVRVYNESLTQQLAFTTAAGGVDGWLPESLASDGTKVYAADSSGPIDLVVNEMAARPQTSGDQLVKTRLGDLPLGGNGPRMAADARDLYMLTGGGVYRYDRASAAFVALVEGSVASSELALNEQYVFWVEEDGVRGVPRAGGAR